MEEAELSLLLYNQAVVNYSMRVRVSWQGKDHSPRSLFPCRAGVVVCACCMSARQQYSAAASVLEYLFKRIEPVDEWVAMRLAFLLLDVYLVLHRGCVADDAVRGSLRWIPFLCPCLLIAVCCCFRTFTSLWKRPTTS